MNEDKPRKMNVAPYDQCEYLSFDNICLHPDITGEECVGYSDCEKYKNIGEQHEQS